MTYHVALQALLDKLQVGVISVPEQQHKRQVSLHSMATSAAATKSGKITHTRLRYDHPSRGHHTTTLLPPLLKNQGSNPSSPGSHIETVLPRTCTSTYAQYSQKK